MSAGDAKIVLITGASGGIGLEASVKIARMGAHVVMVARDRRRGEEAVAAVKARSGRDDVSLLVCDMSSIASVVTLADDFRAQYGRLDVLVNNAGSIKAAREITGDGLEWTFAANYLGHFLLTNLLLDLLRKSAPARVVNVSSAAHRQATIEFDNLQFEKGGYSLLQAYGRSKLAQILFTIELSRRLEGTGVTVNALHPGVVATGIWTRSAFPWYLRAPIAWAKALFMLTPVQGADRVVYLATSSEVEGRSGGYYEKNRRVDPSSTARDQTLARRFWEASAKLARLSTSP
jgi:NAD(P)-dependent dehydrogenase (short-subunit alcohol dehydrogenase family)